MFKKIIYIVVATLLGVIVYLFAAVAIIGGYQEKVIKEEASENNYEFFLRFTTYYNPNPIYESEETDPYKLKIFQIYSEAVSTDTTSDYGYMFIFFDIDTTKINIDSKSDESKYIIHAGEKSFEHSLYLSSFERYGTIYPWLAFGRELGFNSMFDTIDDEGNVTDDVTVNEVDSFTFYDSDGKEFCSISNENSLFDLTKFSAESIKAFDKQGMTSEEISAFNNPSSEIWKETLVLVIYVLIVVGFAIIIFKKPKESKYHAATTNIGGTKPNPYDSITKAAKEERVSLKDAKEMEEVDVVSEEKEDVSFENETSAEENEKDLEDLKKLDE